jgi:hypothetical protein
MIIVSCSFSEGLRTVAYIAVDFGGILPCWHLERRRRVAMKFKGVLFVCVVSLAFFLAKMAGQRAIPKPTSGTQKKGTSDRSKQRENALQARVNAIYSRFAS